MTRQTVKREFEALIGGRMTDELWAAGIAIEAAGNILKEMGWDAKEQDSAFLDQPERTRRSAHNESLACVEDINVKLVINDTLTINLRKDNPERPGVTIPFGMSDRTNTAAMPSGWIAKALYQHLVDVMDGDTAFAQEVADYLNMAIDRAVRDENGKLSVKEVDLPTPRATVFVTSLVDSHKRQFKSQARSSASLNLSAEVIDCVDDETPMRVPPSMIGFIEPTVPTPESAHPKGPTSDAPDGSNQPVLPSTQEVDTEAVGGASVSQTLLSVLSEADEPLTKGGVRKGIAERVPEPLWEAELEILVKTGVIVKQTPGGPRSTRYSLPMTTEVSE